MKVFRVDADERKIGLSRKRVEWAEEAEAEDQAKAAGDSAAQAELKGGVGDASGPLIQPRTSRRKKSRRRRFAVRRHPLLRQRATPCNRPKSKAAARRVARRTAASG